MPAGTVHPCCTSPIPITDETGQPLNIRTHSFDEMWTSHGLQEIRRMMLAGEEPSHCANCYAAERAGFPSVRTNYNAMILDAADAKPVFTGYSRIARDQLRETMPKPTYFDLRFDNVCNLKCVICFASESSAIEADPVHTAWTKDKPIERGKNRFTNSRKWVASEQLQSELIEIGENAEYIRLAGGEPFRSAAALRWMDHLVETGKSKNITLQVYTNFHRFDQRLVDMLSAFKFVSLILSIDGTGATYEYVRYPGKWATIEANAARLVERQKDQLRGIGVSLNATMSILGAFDIADVFEWAGRHQFGVTLSNAVDPEYVSIRYLPEASKNRLEAILREVTAQWPHAVLRSQADQWIADMRSIDSRTTRDKVMNVVNFIGDMDRSRNLNFSALQPELMAEFERQIAETEPRPEPSAEPSVATIIQDAPADTTRASTPQRFGWLKGIIMRRDATK